MSRGSAPAAGRHHRGFECWKPIVAAVQGNCLGGGLELALCADIRIADTTAQLGSPEVKWGLMQGTGATQRLPRFVPFGVALRCCSPATPSAPTRAERIGLVNERAPGRSSPRCGVASSPGASSARSPRVCAAPRKPPTAASISPSPMACAPRSCSAAPSPVRRDLAEGRRRRFSSGDGHWTAQ